jgi:hypothetical protein
MSQKQDMELARKRAEVVFAVRGGKMTAEEGARLLGVSRKTYYEWENRALLAMMAAMENKAVGRPPHPQDEENQRLQAQVAELEKKLFVAEKTVEVRDMLHAYELHKAGATKSAGQTLEKKQKQKNGQ